MTFLSSASSAQLDVQKQLGISYRIDMMRLEGSRTPDQSLGIGMPSSCQEALGDAFSGRVGARLDREPANVQHGRLREFPELDLIPAA